MAGYAQKVCADEDLFGPYLDKIKKLDTRAVPF